MRSILVIVAGAFMLVSALAHGLGGWPMMRGELAKIGAPAELVGGLRAGWLWGSAAMAAFGTIVIVAAIRLRRGDPSGLFAIRLVAVCYVVFGLAAFVAQGFEPFFLNFAAAGALAGVPTLRSTSLREGHR